MQRFWDSALALEPPDEEFDSHRFVDGSFDYFSPVFLWDYNITLLVLFSEVSLLLQSEAGDGKSSVYPPVMGNSFSFKLQDRKGRVHRFTCGIYLFHGLPADVRYGCIVNYNWLLIFQSITAGSDSLDELVSSVRQRLSIADEKEAVQLLVRLTDQSIRMVLWFSRHTEHLTSKHFIGPIG